MEEQHIFNALNEVDISEYIKEKPGKVKIKYLPWASAWKFIKSKYPDAKKSVIKDVGGNLYHTDGKTCWVETSLTINGETQTEELPVMNHLNQPITLENITSTDVNKAKQRCFVKTAALFGLGLSLWVGEELSEEAKQKKKQKTEEEAKELAVLEEKRGQIVTLAKELIQAGVDSNLIYTEIRKISGKKNPNAIEKIEDCDLILTFLTEKEKETNNNAE